MTSSFLEQQNQYPFSTIDDEVMSTNNAARGTKPAARNSLTMSSREKMHADSNAMGGNHKDTTHRDDETDSFISAPDSPSAMQRQIAEQKLRLKKEKVARQKFNDLKQMKNQSEVKKVFGNLADQRASDPVTLQGALKHKRSTVGDIEENKDRVTSKTLDENYFNRFASTPNNQQLKDHNKIVPEKDGAHFGGNQFFANANQGVRSSFQSSRSKNKRSKSEDENQLLIGPISVPGQEKSQ